MNGDVVGYYGFDRGYIFTLTGRSFACYRTWSILIEEVGKTYDKNFERSEHVKAFIEEIGIPIFKISKIVKKNNKEYKVTGTIYSSIRKKEEVTNFKKWIQKYMEMSIASFETNLDTEILGKTKMRKPFKGIWLDEEGNKVLRISRYKINAIPTFLSFQKEPHGMVYSQYLKEDQTLGYIYFEPIYDEKGIVKEIIYEGKKLKRKK